MRPSHLVAAALTSGAGLASAQASSSISCTTITSTSTSTSTYTTASEPGYSTTYPWSEPPTPSNPHGTSISTLNFTLTEQYTSSAGAPTATTGSGGGNTTASASSTTSSVATVSSNVAAPGEGLAGDSSMLGLVVFFALSLCLL